MSTTYEVDLKDQRLTDVQDAGNKSYNEVSSAYNTAIKANNNAKDKALGEIGKMEANDEWTKNTAIGNLIDSQNEQTDFAIKKIEQQKDQAHQDYIKEQSAAYTDYQKQTAQHGVNAEKMAAQGLQNTGYAESSMVAMYNQHQARVTAAREAYQKIALDYENQMTNARLQNSATIAQIAYEGMQKRLEMLMQYTMYGNQLLTEMATAKANVKNQNFQNYMSVYNQLLEENKYKTSVEQHNETTGGSGTDTSSTNGGNANSRETAKVQRASSKASDKGRTLTVDMDSVTNLGYGPISAKRLNELVSKGYVEEYREGNKLKYRRKGIAKYTGIKHM